MKKVTGILFSPQCKLHKFGNFYREEFKSDYFKPGGLLQKHAEAA
jgi:hypothetical protein